MWIITDKAGNGEWVSRGQGSGIVVYKSRATSLCVRRVRHFSVNPKQIVQIYIYIDKTICFMLLLLLRFSETLTQLCWGANFHRQKVLYEALCKPVFAGGVFLLRSVMRFSRRFREFGQTKQQSGWPGDGWRASDNSGTVSDGSGEQHGQRRIGICR